jgi:plasmid stabilization system protein ParE
MTHRLIIREQAEADLTDAAIWYESQRPGLGTEFLAEVDAALARASATPRQFRRLRRKPDVRRALTKRFLFCIFFVLRPDAVVVFRVLHGARHQREWKRNTPEN